MKIDHLTREDKEKLARYLMRCYVQAHENIEYMKDCDMIYENIEEYRSEKKTCMLIRRAMRDMNRELREILNAEFIENQKLYKVSEKYSRSSYYRLRSQAIDDFLRCL